MHCPHCDPGVFFSEEGTHQVLAPTLKRDPGKVTDLIVYISCSSKLHNFALANLHFGM